jgi:hypothetical protein
MRLETMERLPGVTVVAILMFTGAGLLVLRSFGFFLLGATALNPEAPIPQSFARIGMIGGGVLLSLAIISAAVAFYLLKAAPWARYVAIIFNSAGTVFAVLEVLTSLPHPHTMVLARQLCVAAISGGIVVYLVRPSVKKSFNTS